MSRQGGGLEHARSLRRASHFAPASLLSDSQPAMPRSASAQSIPRQGGSSVAASGMMPASSGSKPPRPAQSHNRKPSDKLRKQRNGPSVDSTASNGASRNANLDRRKSRVDGLLKQKRQSVSFAAAESQGLMPGQPDLPPPVPGGDYSMAPRQQPRRQDRALATALEEELAREDFNADTCVCFPIHCL